MEAANQLPRLVIRLMSHRHRQQQNGAKAGGDPQAGAAVALCAETLARCVCFLSLTLRI